MKRASGIAGGRGLGENENCVTEGNVNEPVSPTEDNKENFPSATESKEVHLSNYLYVCKKDLRKGVTWCISLQECALNACDSYVYL